MAGKVIADDGMDVIPSDTVNLTKIGSLFIGTGGNVKVITEMGTTLTYKNLPDGSMLPVTVKRVFDTDTTASDMILNL